jgi:uncharacterized protein (TIGR02453 family)
MFFSFVQVTEMTRLSATSANVSDDRRRAIPEPVTPTRFTGFDRDALQFFHELAVEMNREWFAANKQRYLVQWVQPMTALLAEVRARLAPSYAPIRVGAPGLFRIHRDTRFSTDKTPYKTHIAARLPLHARLPIDGGCSALFFELGVDDEYAGAGTYFFDREQLVRWRKLVAADRAGRAVATLIDKLRSAGYRVGGHDDYKRVPAGFAPDHPRAALLKLRGLTVAFPAIPPGLVHRRALIGWLVKHCRATAPLASWLYRHVK